MFFEREFIVKFFYVGMVRLINLSRTAIVTSIIFIRQLHQLLLNTYIINNIYNNNLLLLCYYFLGNVDIVVEYQSQVNHKS